MNDQLLDNFKSLISCAMSYSQLSYKYVFNDTSNYAAAVAYLNIASSKFSAAEALYYSRFSELQQTNAAKLFYLFDVYSRELLSNFATNHSHQWTGIEYDRLQECFDNSVFAPESK